MALGVAISRKCRDDVTDPAEPAARAHPDARRDDQPEYAAKNLAVINLAYARDEKAEYCCDTWISHISLIPLYDQ